MATEQASLLGGGQFLVKTSTPGGMLAPEDFTSEQRQYAKTARDFVEKELIPLNGRIEEKDLELLRSLMGKAGELGLLMGDVPEEYGGLALSKASCALINENMAGQGSFHVAYLVQTGIGMLPLVYYGNPDLKEKYLPGLADGSLIGCYGLTEPSAGSDALAARTKAVLSEDGAHYILNGTKQFITSSRISDVMFIFAKVDGRDFTCFLVPSRLPGVSFGPEEHKMGIKGSTTSTIVLQDVKVPVDHVIGEVGQGHKIAFNILNIGRFKLGAMAVGIAKRGIAQALAYTLERKQFNTRIADFGAIREKLGKMAVRTYAAESMAYRTVGLIDALLESSGDKHGEGALRSIEEYSIECSIAKIHGSETLDYVVDEYVQCLGGYGYCAEYPAEAFYRDSRINRIYEGTNEINRIIVPTMLARKASALGLMNAATFPDPAGTGTLAAETAMAENLKKMALLTFMIADGKLGKALAKNQALQLRIADLVTAAFVTESTVLRAMKDNAARGEAAELSVAAAKAVAEEAMVESYAKARQCLVALGAQDAMSALDALAVRESADLVMIYETIAAKMVENERPVF